MMGRAETSPDKAISDTHRRVHPVTWDNKRKRPTWAAGLHGETKDVHTSTDSTPPHAQAHGKGHPGTRPMLCNTVPAPSILAGVWWRCGRWRKTGGALSSPHLQASSLGLCSVPTEVSTGATSASRRCSGKLLEERPQLCHLLLESTDLEIGRSGSPRERKIRESG